jgi:hypothetical protein
VLALAACSGSAEKLDPSAPETVITCPSDDAPERCNELATTAAGDGHADLAWAYTVLDCESQHPAHCAAMWQRNAKFAPTQTDALNVLHSACAREPSACTELASWHRVRGHSLAASAYDKHAEALKHSHAGPEKAHDNALALAGELATVMHVSGARTDAIAQMIGHAPLPVAPVVAAAKPSAKAWPMHAASLISSSSTCSGAPVIDRHPVALEQCVSEVRPFTGEEIALRNRCNRAVTVVYKAERGRSPYVNQIRLEPYEGRSLGITHHELGELTYAPCLDNCMATINADDRSSPWKGDEGIYYCSGALRP